MHENNEAETTQEILRSHFEKNREVKIFPSTSICKHAAFQGKLTVADRK